MGIPMTARDPAKSAQSLWPVALITLAIPFAAAVAERCMGRLFLSQSGAIRLWVSQTNGPETSQQFFDWYSITHMTHGIVFYFFAWLIGRGKWSVKTLFFIALTTESAWEVFENCPFTINRFRAATAADGYNGDTILNSMCDIVSCMAGWALAKYLPAWATITFVVLTEVTLALAVRDNLTLSILMLIHPVEAIKQWQHGG
jgi:hypothetical protein